MDRNASVVLLWYLILNKRILATRLLKIDGQNRRIYNFMLNDFTEARWRKAAKQNAYKLMQLKKYQLSAAFFLLAGSLEECLQVV